jgi:hypothetical protein
MPEAVPDAAHARDVLRTTFVERGPFFASGKGAKSLLMQTIPEHALVDRDGIVLSIASHWRLKSPRERCRHRRIFPPLGGECCFQFGA